MSTKQSTGHSDTAHLQERSTAPEYCVEALLLLKSLTIVKLSREFSVTSSNVSSANTIEATITTAV